MIVTTSHCSIQYPKCDGNISVSNRTSVFSTWERTAHPKDPILAQHQLTSLRFRIAFVFFQWLICSILELVLYCDRMLPCPLRLGPMLQIGVPSSSLSFNCRYFPVCYKIIIFEPLGSFVPCPSTKIAHMPKIASDYPCWILLHYWTFYHKCLLTVKWRHQKIREHCSSWHLVLFT